MSAFSFLALAAEVEGAGVLPAEDGVGGFSAFSLGFSFSLALSGSRSWEHQDEGLAGSSKSFDVDVGVGLECATDVLA